MTNSTASPTTEPLTTESELRLAIETDGYCFSLPGEGRT